MKSDSESDGNNSDEGAKYNDFDRKEHSLLDIDEISEDNFSQEVFQRGISSITEEVAIELVPENMMDDTFLARDEEHLELWQRHHDLLIYDGDINSRRHHKCVLLLSVGRYKRAGYCEEDLIRFRIRERNHWEAVDSLYDAWLLLEGKQHKEFNYELFMTRFPGWEDHIHKKYKPPESDIETVHLVLQNAREKELLICLMRKVFKKQQYVDCRIRNRGCTGRSNALLTRLMKKLRRKQQLVVNCKNRSRTIWNHLHHQKLPSKETVLYLARNSVKKNSRQTLKKIHPYLLHHRKWKNTQHLN